MKLINPYYKGRVKRLLAQSQKNSRPVASSLKPATQNAIVWFSDTAITKLMTLVMASKLEVGWHGIGCKQGVGEYYIEDIFLYPQTVTATTIYTAEEEYAKWQTQMVMTDADRFEKLCFHGHSHVDMRPISSAVDRDLQDDIIEMIQPDDFYIFIIVNKDFEFYFKIADRSDGVIYETLRSADMPKVILGTESGILENILIEKNDMVRQKAHTVYRNWRKYNEY